MRSFRSATGILMIPMRPLLPAIYHIDVLANSKQISTGNEAISVPHTQAMTQIIGIAKTTTKQIAIAL